MKNEKKYAERENFKIGCENAATFQDIFRLLRVCKTEECYSHAYEEAAQLARFLVETKKRLLSWNPAEFKKNMKEKYPDIQDYFIDALTRCVEHYNPPVNIPNQPLWE